ncbi:helix-turn-helix domain-containing protein [Marinilabilia salmonicolor]|uniref:Excisionase family DNA binding protein n=1 Tax=Marinilabilia salmonicolor TaxID=989 RepID=A0A368ULC7_9BACT|nr:helix-turn-helix domain-containing protein [Marinilabilia salmonicolor]RCW29567.1 excisionase family DNA binding protein [Marinilabilia salmonicolor]
MDMNIERIQQREMEANLANIGLLNQKVDYLIQQISMLGNKLGEVNKQTVEEENDIIQVKEAAKIIGRSESTVYIKASKKQLPCWNDGGRLLFSRKDLREWVLANRTQCKEETAKSKMRTIRNRYAKK